MHASRMDANGSNGFANNTKQSPCRSRPIHRTVDWSPLRFTVRVHSSTFMNKWVSTNVMLGVNVLKFCFICYVSGGKLASSLVYHNFFGLVRIDLFQAYVGFNPVTSLFFNSTVNLYLHTSTFKELNL